MDFLSKLINSLSEIVNSLFELVNDLREQVIFVLKKWKLWIPYLKLLMGFIKDQRLIYIFVFALFILNGIGGPMVTNILCKQSGGGLNPTGALTGSGWWG